MSYRRDLWELAASCNGLVTVATAEDVDGPDEDFASYEGIQATTVRRALEDMRDRIPPDRWEALVEQAFRARPAEGWETSARVGIGVTLSQGRRVSIA